MGFIISLVYSVRALKKGRQVEKPDDWLREGNPWEIARPQYSQKVKLYGHVEHGYDDLGNYRPQWASYKEVEGIPYDLAVVGYETDTVNFPRLCGSLSLHRSSTYKFLIRVGMWRQ